MKAKCSEKTTCEAMAGCLDHDTKSGIASEVVMDLAGKTINSILVVRSGRFKRRGIVLNMCPFCGYRFKIKVR